MKTEIHIPIRGYHIDHFGHVNHARFIEFLEEARWHYLEENRLFDLFHQTGIIHVVAHLSVNYKGSASAGQIIKIETGLALAGKKNFTIEQNVFLEDFKILDAKILNVFVDLGSQKAVKPSASLIAGWQDLAASIERGKDHG